MPFYTFKCRTCNLEKEEMRKMGDYKEPLCPVCAYNVDVDGKYEMMEKLSVMWQNHNSKVVDFMKQITGISDDNI